MNTPPANINTTDYWDGVYRQEWEKGLVHAEKYSRDYGPIHDAVIALIDDGARVLDIACGMGVLCRKIKQRRPNCRVTGVDFSQFAVDRNRELDRELGIDYRQCDIRTELPSLSAPFDVVCMCEILEHLDQPLPVLVDAMSLLRPAGRFIITCPHDNEIPDPEHVRAWGHDDLFHALAPYSPSITFQHFPPPWYHIWMLAHLQKT